jgi:dolichol-phosphate mannosyltransferase
MSKKLISIVTPVYNEEANVERLYAAVKELMAAEAERYLFEIVFTDNHSTDHTFAKLREIAGGDSRVRVYRFSRNFGYQRSVYTGLTLARGAAAVELDCDLQDPPHVIRDFIRLWEEGYQVVYGIRRKRQEGLIVSAERRLFYWLVNKLSEDQLPGGAGDFRLVDRRILDELRKIRDPHIYIRGRVATMGFRQIGIPYDREARASGDSKFNFHRNLQLAVDAITSHSAVPLRFATYFGFFVTGLTGIGLVVYTIVYFTTRTAWPPGFATLLFALLGTIGMFSFFFGIIGEYLGRLYEHVKVSSENIIEEQINNADSAAPHS